MKRGLHKITLEEKRKIVGIVERFYSDLQTEFTYVKGELACVYFQPDEKTSITIDLRSYKLLIYGSEGNSKFSIKSIIASDDFFVIETPSIKVVFGEINFS